MHISAKWNNVKHYYYYYYYYSLLPKDLGDISLQAVLVNFVSNFVATATNDGRGEIRLASSNSPSPTPLPPLDSNIFKISFVKTEL